jgi:Xaa-Pro aminopeptidase
VPDVLVYADTFRSPELRHEVPLAIPDPFFYAETGGRRVVVINNLELPRLRGLEGVEVIAEEELGVDELIAQGVERADMHLQIGVRACRRLGIEDAVVPATFPVALADELRASGVQLRPDRTFFAARRRVKTAAELAGIRRAQRAAEEAMDAARDLLRRARSNGSGLQVDGEPLTCELVKHAIGEVFTRRDMVADELIVSHGGQSAVGHDTGSGSIAAGEPIIVDIWPKDRATACHADMTRTFVVGEPPAELVEYHRLVKQALDEAIGRIRAGIEGREVYVGTCRLFQEHGFPTGLSKEPGEVLVDGFYHGLGHGLGLEVHEEPNMGLAGRGELVAGDVVTVEPGLYRPGFGGCRLEDVVLVTDDGAENLTDYPYDLAA